MTTKTRKTAPKRPTTNETAAARPKRALLLDYLGEEDGVAIDALSERLGWLRHTTRAALTRLRQEGHLIERLPPADGSRLSRYRLGGQ